MLSSKVQMILNGRICFLDSQMEMLWSAPVLGLLVKTATQLDLSFKSHVRHECNCMGKNAMARFSLALSREDNGCEVSLLSLFHRWISSFLDFSGRFSWRGVC